MQKKGGRTSERPDNLNKFDMIDNIKSKENPGKVEYDLILLV